jgi:hypothetical protein
MGGQEQQQQQQQQLGGSDPNLIGMLVDEVARLKALVEQKRARQAAQAQMQGMQL